MSVRRRLPRSSRVLHGALPRLEPCAVKVARTVLRGRGVGNDILLPDHCYIHASVPRVKCPEHGVKLIEVPWARNGGAFTQLFEQAALTLVREMPVIVGARIIEITDKRLWRIVEHCVAKAEALTYRRCRPSGGTRRRAGGGRTTSRCLSTWNVVTSRCCS